MMKRLSISYICKIALLMLIISIYIFAPNPNFNSVYKIICIFFITVTILYKLMKKSSIKLSFFSFWYILFVLYSATTFLWAEKIDFNIIMAMLLNFVIILCILNYITSKAQLIEFLKVLVYAGIFFSLYLILNYDTFNLISQGMRLNPEFYNANEIALKIFISFSACVYLYKEHKSKIYLVPMGIFIYILILAGSKKIFLYFILFLFIIYFLKSNKQSFNWKYVIIGSVLILIVLYCVFNIEWIYNILGIRIEEFIDLIFKGEGNNGDELRMYMIDLGKSLIVSKPLLGYGVNNFSLHLYTTIGWEAYAHNNFIEVLVSGGIIGFIIYYWIYFYLFLCLIKMYSKTYNQKGLLVYCIALFSPILILEYGAVTCYNISYQLIICITYIIVNLIRKSS